MTNKQEQTTMPIIGIIGAGTMGAGIAQVAATAGHLTILFDTNTEVLSKSKTILNNTLNTLVEKGKLSKENADGIFNKIYFAEKLTDFKSCDLIIEAIIENIEIKQKLFNTLEEIVSNKCVLASNTSSLSITSIAASCKNSKRVLGIHFFNPAPLMPLVELIPGLNTDIYIANETKKLIDSWGKVTVLAKDTPGFIVNRIARPFYGESIRLYEEGLADFATIDWAMKEFAGFRMGPFELMDFIGNDVNYKVTETVWEQFFYEPRFKPSFTQKRLFEARNFGRKSGIGYYDYSPNVLKPEPLKDKTLAEKISSRVLAMLINEAAEALFLDVATKEDIDLAMTKGVNYPKGLLKWADEIGIEKVLKTLRDLYDEYGEDRYRPCVLLKRMIKEKRNFF